ncbi:hypothetical protein [Shewanella algae]|uniref:hypothetical protein n=1 Tax=Shewanella algae TaxID=38313 RepID=UPI000D1ADE56|nr:hypothetical protein [Shewanella algae]
MSDNTKLSQTKLFWTAIGVPAFIALLIGLAIYCNNDTASLLAGLLDKYKIPITILSLSIPFVAWVTANHRSEQTMKGLALQREKRLYDLYYEHQKHFEKVMGRRIKNSKFQYILEEDLPVIFSELYEFNSIQEKGMVNLKATAVEEINRFLVDTGEIIYEFYAKFSEYQEENPEQKRVLSGFCLQMYQLLQGNLHQLSNDLGFRFVDLKDTSVNIFSSAYSEIIQLSYFMGDDFKVIWDTPPEIDGNQRYENILETFSAIEELISNHTGIIGGASFSNLQSSISLGEVLKKAQGTPLQILVMQIYDVIIKILKANNGDENIKCIEGKYDKFEIVIGEECLELFFEEISNNEGHLILKTSDSVFRSHFIILDDDNSKNDSNSNPEVKYTIDDDMGTRFLQDFSKSVLLALRKSNSSSSGQNS